MVHVMAIIPVQPAHLAAVKEALSTLAAASRLEAGCARYEVFERENQPVLVTQETWADVTTEQLHLAGPNVARAFAAVGGWLAAAPEIHRYTQLA